MKQSYTRAQRTTIVYGMLCLVMMLVILQLWLLTASMNAFLGGDQEVLLPSLLVSLGCLVLNVGLLAYLYRMES